MSAAKISPLLLATSLALNLALLAWVSLHFSHPSASEPPAPSSSPSLPLSTSAHVRPLPLSPAQAAALRSADLDQMKAAGVPDDVANILAAGRLFALGQALDRTRQKSQKDDGRYWRNSRGESPELSEDQQREENQLQEQFTAAMERAFPGWNSGNEATLSRYSFLRPLARDKLFQIEKDYAELETGIRSHAASGILLASDNAKLKLLHDEKQRDIAAVLSPAELESFQLRDENSDTVRTIRSRYGDAIESESDYQKIFVLQKAFDSRFPSQGEADVVLRDAAHTQLQADILSVIGEEKYAAFQHEHDQSYRDLTTIAERLKLPSATPDLVYATRDRYAADSQAIAQNSALSPATRDTQLKALAEKAAADLTAQLGHEGAEAYTVRAQWVHLLRNGTPFSTNLKDAPAYTDIGVTEFPAPRVRP